MNDKTDLHKLLQKVKGGTGRGDSMRDFYNDIIDAYNSGVLEKKDFLRIMGAVSNRDPNYGKQRS